MANFTAAIEADPMLDEAYYRRAITRERQEDFQGALKDYGVALKLKPYKNTYRYGVALFLAGVILTGLAARTVTPTVSHRIGRGHSALRRLAETHARWTNRDGIVPIFERPAWIIARGSLGRAVERALHLAAVVGLYIVGDLVRSQRSRSQRSVSLRAPPRSFSRPCFWDWPFRFIAATAP